MDWRFTDARTKFSELVTRALSEGPQRIRRRNEAVVVLSEDEYNRLTGKRPSFKEFLRNGPGLEDLDLARDPAPMRPTNL